MRNLFAATLAVVIVVGLYATPVASVQADDQEPKKMKIIRTDGSEIVGIVEETPTTYRVKVTDAITVTLRKSEVRRLEPIDAAPEPVALSGGARRPISESEIQHILGSEELKLSSMEFVKRIDLMEPLPLDEEGLEEMLRIAGRKAKPYITDHFVCVSTADPALTRQMVARFEAVYRWRAWLVEWAGIEPVRPEKKFETFFFGDHAEFQGYSTLHGDMSGALGFWHPIDNRSAYFDCNSYPIIKRFRERYANPDLSGEIRRLGNNLCDRWVEDYNYEVVQHEAGHHIDFNIGIFPMRGDVPRWLAEGLTQLFEVAPTRMGASFGKINAKKLSELRMQFGPELQGLPPLRDFMLHDAIWFQGYNYPRGWALAYYLIKKHPEGFKEFLRIIAQREDDWGVRIPLSTKLAQMERLFGDIDEEWNEDFKEFINALPVNPEELTPDISEFP